MFATVNRGLHDNNDWIILNKLPLNIKKSKILHFQKAGRRDDLPLVLPNLFIKIKKQKDNYL